MCMARSISIKYALAKLGLFIHRKKKAIIKDMTKINI